MTGWMGWPWRGRARRAGGAEPSELTMALRFELAGEEERALAASYAVSMALGVAWLALVRFGPMIATLEPGIAFVKPDSALPRLDSVIVQVVPPDFPSTPFDPPVHGPVDNAVEATRRRGEPSRAPGGASANAERSRAIAGAFATRGAAVDPSTILRNVDVTPGGAQVPPGEFGPKVALSGGGRGGEGRPGFWAPSARSGGAAGRIASVGGAGGVAREAARVVAPPVVQAPVLGSSRSFTELGGVARARAAELESCYEREGRSRQPTVAGAVVVDLAIDPDGRVTSAVVTRRTWTGEAASATETCVLRAVRRWRFPQASGGTTFALPLSFTSAAR